MAQVLEEKDLDPGSAPSVRPQHTDPFENHIRCNFIEICARLGF